MMAPGGKHPDVRPLANGPAGWGPATQRKERGKLLTEKELQKHWGDQVLCDFLYGSPRKHTLCQHIWGGRAQSMNAKALQLFGVTGVFCVTRGVIT